MKKGPFDYTIIYSGKNFRGHKNVNTYLPLCSLDSEELNKYMQVEGLDMAIVAINLLPSRGHKQAFCRLWARIKSGRW